MSKIVLVTGGARSGKSRFAEAYATKYGQKIAYIATAQILDEEMALRVALHQNRRPKMWPTFEAPYDAHLALAQAGKDHDMILFDCLTMYLSNMLCSGTETEKDVREKISELIAAAKKNKGAVIFVTNEVGAGIVPENKLARQYRDLAGLVNQEVAQAAEEVYLVTAGLAIDMKKLAVNL